MAFKKGQEAWNKGQGDYMKGEKNHFYGKHHTEITKEKLRQANCNPSKKNRQKNSERIKGKTYEEIYGIERAKEMKKKLSDRLKQDYKKGKRKSWNKGKKGCFSEEAIEKLKEARIGKSSPMKGKKQSEKTKRKIGKANKIANLGIIPSKKSREKMSIAKRGEKSHFWKGGKSFEPYGLEFNNQLKEQIRARDHYRCQQCFRHQDELFVNIKSGIRPYKLHIHHIDYNKQNNNPENLISLCLNCHAQTNFKRTNWTNYFKEKVNKL